MTGPASRCKRLAKDPLWRVVQAHPSAVRFPGEDGESHARDAAPGGTARSREWNARLGQDAVYLICSHGDVIKSIIADSLGLHLDLSQRIQVDPCSLSVIRYTPLRPFLVRMNDTGASSRPACAGRPAGQRGGGAGRVTRPVGGRTREDKDHAGLLV